MFVDSHCHLNYPDYNEDLDDVIQRAKSVNIKRLLTVCTEMAEVQSLIDLANSRDGLYCSVGVHPHEAKQAIAQGGLYDQLVSLAAYDKVIGLGETGLDYYYEHSPKEEQRQAFQIHIDVAKATGLPLIIHTRDAEEDTINMLMAEKGNLTGVFHCFSGSLMLAKQALELGFYISISGIITFKKADDLRDIVKQVPLDRILVETDAPYLAPIPMRGKRNEPAFMVYTAQTIAEIKGVTMQELAQQTTENFEAVFPKGAGGFL